LNPLVHDVVQRSPEWHALRATRIGSSDAEAVLAVGARGGEAVTRRDLRYRLALAGLRQERAEPEGGYDNADMRRGRDLETEALWSYELATGRVVLPVGYVTDPDQPLLGYSPDGVVVEDGRWVGLVEVKCPRSATHHDTLTTQTEGKYTAQLTHALTVCADVQWIDFVSYDPRFPRGRDLCIIRRTRTNLPLDIYTAALTQLQSDVANTRAAITGAH
jgi:hypothetical protein